MRLEAQAGADGARPLGRRPSSPYVYLNPFHEENEPFFFGRERETGDIIASLKTRRLTLLYGPSGVGKSSVLNAGVAHHLRRIAARQGPPPAAPAAAAGAGLALDLPPGALPDFVPPSKPRFAVVVFKLWSGNPLEDLREAIFAELRVPPGRRDACPPGLAETIRALTEVAGERLGLLIILDQFEEFFVYHPPDAGGGDGGFADEFARAVADPRLKANFLISIREDWLARLDRFRGRIPDLFESYLRVTHLDRVSAEAAVVGPVKAYNDLLRQLDGDAARVVEIEDGFVGRVLDQLEKLNDRVEDAVTISAHGFQRTISVADGRIQTPDLQIVMTRLWERMREGPRLVLSQHLLTEGDNTAREIINADLGRRLGSLSPQEQAAAAKLFPCLISTLDTKVSHTAQDIAAHSDLKLGEVSSLVSRLAALGILRQVPHSPGQQNLPRYEIAHDVLARPLQAWSTRVRSEIHGRNREKRHRDAVIRRGLAVIVCILLIAAAVLYGSFVAARQNRRRAERAQAEAERQKSEAERERAQAQKTLAVIRKLDEDTPHSKAVLRGHSAAVTGAAFFHEGHVLTASADGTLRVWAVETKESAAEWESEQGPLTALALDARGGRAATGAEDGSVKLWDLSDKGGRVLRDSAGAAPVTDVEFSPGGELIAAADNQGVVLVWEVGGGRALQRFMSHKGAVTQLAFSPDGRLFASASADGTARVVRVSDWRETTLQGHAGAVRGLAFSPDGRSVATASADKTVRLWNAETGTWRPVGRHAAEVNTVEFARDGKRLVTAGDDATARLWTIGDEEPKVFSGSPAAVSRATLSPDGKLVATASEDDIVRVWSPAAREALAELRGHLSGVTSLAFSADGALVLTASEDATARLWSTPRPTSNLFVERLTIDAIPGHYVGQCPITIRFFVGITASGPGTVAYQFSQSGGPALPVRSHTFAEPGTKYVDWFRRVRASGDYWEDINIIEPRSVEPRRAKFKVRCTEEGGPPPGREAEPEELVTP